MLSFIPIHFDAVIDMKQNLHLKTRDALRMIARDFDISVSGTKSELHDRCLEAINLWLSCYESQKEDGRGRPSLGETKKISLTLDPVLWERFDSDAKHAGGRSPFLRDLIESYYYMRDQERQIAADLYGEDSVL